MICKLCFNKAAKSSAKKFALKKASKNVAKKLNRHFTKEDIQMANKHMKSAQHHSLLEKCKSKITMRYHYMPVRNGCYPKVYKQ